MNTYTLSAEYINGEFLELQANGLTDFITQALSQGIKINAVSYLPLASCVGYDIYKCTVEGVFISGTKNLMVHHIEVV
jgi:hypothetical protein